MAWPESVRIDPLGEHAFLLRDLGDAPPAQVAAALSKVAGIQEATCAYETVGVYVDPDFRAESLPDLLRALVLEEAGTPRRHEIPVCYAMGEDLAGAAERLGLTQDALIERHSAVDYRCHAVGFQPGFPFLGYLPERLAGLTRRPSPRTQVPPGSVGIVGRQTGIYPSASPGGWWLIGRTPLTIVDPADAYFPIAAGDLVRFVPIAPAEFAQREGQRL